MINGEIKIKVKSSVVFVVEFGKITSFESSLPTDRDHLRF